MMHENIFAGILIMFVLLFAGCSGTGPSEVTTSSAETTLQVVSTSQFATTTTTHKSTSTTTATSSTSSTSTTKPLPMLPANITSADCYAKGFFWCAGKCSRSECGDCFNYKRCIVLNGTINSVKVETAEQVSQHEGSCEYAGSYTNAGGPESYCDIHEGTLINAKCGVDGPDPSDCYKLSGGNQTNRAPYGSRSFHSTLGAQYDLWCFRCDVVGQ